MKYKLIIDTTIEDEGLIKNDNDPGDVISIRVNDISSFFPKISDRIIKTIKDDIINYYPEISVEEIINSISNHNNCIEIIVINCDENNFNIINEYLPSGCVINLEKVGLQEEKRLIFNCSYRDDLFYNDKYNRYSNMSLNELRDTFTKISNMTKYIKQSDFSPLERIIFIADIVRNKSYKKSDGSRSESRDINKLFTGDAIVCEGYSNLFAAMCEETDIPCEKIIWHSDINQYIGHASNLVYINDNKYNIHQFFEIDLTMYSKTNTNEFLTRYDFLMPIERAKLIKRKHSLTIDNNTQVDHIDSRSDSLRKMEALFVPDIILKRQYILIVKAILEVAKNINDKKLVTLCNQFLISEEKSKEGLDSINTYYNEICNEEIDIGKLMTAIYKVRRVEYLTNPQKYELDKELLYIIYDNILNNSNIEKNRYEKFLKIILGDMDYSSILDRIIINCNLNIDGKNSEDKIDKDINRLKMLYLLREELKKRTIEQKVYKK